MPTRQNPFLKRTIGTANRIMVTGPRNIGRGVDIIAGYFSRKIQQAQDAEDFQVQMENNQTRSDFMDENNITELSKDRMVKAKTGNIVAAELKAQRLRENQGKEGNVEDLDEDEQTILKNLTSTGESNTSIEEKVPDVTEDPAKSDPVPVSSQGQGTPIPVTGYWSQKPKISFEPGEVKPEMKGPFPVENPFKNVSGTPPKGRRAITADEIFKPSQETKTSVDTWFASMGLGANEAKTADPVRQADLTGDTRVENPQLGGKRNTPIWDKMFDGNK